MNEKSAINLEHFRSSLIRGTVRDKELSEEKKLKRIEQYINLDYDEMIYLLIESHRNSCSVGHLLENGIPLPF